MRHRAAVDCLAGGQGAPLAPIYHAALLRRAEAGPDVAVLNLGGVGNLGADPRFADPEQPYYVKPRSQFARRFTDYDHLSRWPEWGASGGGE